MPLAELARIVYFRGDTLPPDLPRELMQTRHFITKEYPFAFTNGVQACWLEVDVDTGMVQLLKHWCVEDCGRIINPLLVDEQVRGGIVQGIGGALYEHCVYSPEGQLLVGSMADYLVPMAAEMPDIEVGHVETPTEELLLGAKGAGEAGTAGAPAAVMNAINDALQPFGAKVFAQPFTPERILAALGKVPARWPERLPERAAHNRRGRKVPPPPLLQRQPKKRQACWPACLVATRAASAAAHAANARIGAFGALCHRAAIRLWRHGPRFSKISGSWSWHGVTAKQEGGAPWTSNVARASAVTVLAAGLGIGGLAVVHNSQRLDQQGKIVIAAGNPQYFDLATRYKEDLRKYGVEVEVRRTTRVKDKEGRSSAAAAGGPPDAAGAGRQRLGDNGGVREGRPRRQPAGTPGHREAKGPACRVLEAALGRAAISRADLGLHPRRLADQDPARSQGQAHHHRHARERRAGHCQAAPESQWRGRRRRHLHRRRAPGRRRASRFRALPTPRSSSLPPTRTGSSSSCACPTFA